MSDRSNAQEYDKLSDIRGEWWLAVEVYACLACGALVADKAKHDYWHNPTPRYVTDEDHNPDDYEPLEWQCVDCGREEVSPNIIGWRIGHEGTRCPACAAKRQIEAKDAEIVRLNVLCDGHYGMWESCAKRADHYRAALERIDQSPLGADTYAMRVIAQQAIVAYDPEYPNNQRERLPGRSGYCPLCKQFGDLVGPSAVGGKEMWWHRRPQPERPDAFCGPFERAMCQADDRCLKRDGHVGPCG